MGISLQDLPVLTDCVRPELSRWCWPQAIRPIGKAFLRSIRLIVSEKICRGFDAIHQFQCLIHLQLTNFFVRSDWQLSAPQSPDHARPTALSLDPTRAFVAGDPCHPPIPLDQLR